MLLETIFNSYGEVFKKKIFICIFKYTPEEKMSDFEFCLGTSKDGSLCKPQKKSGGSIEC